MPPDEVPQRRLMFGAVESAMLSRFLEAATQWARERDNIVGLASIGSHARNAARPDSDVDLFVLCKDSRLLIDDKSWTARFGDVVNMTTEKYGPTGSIRVFYRAGPEVEFGIAESFWASVPLDAGTRRVISDGIRILHDPVCLFREAAAAAAGSGFSCSA